MERSFIATKDSKYVQNLNKYIELSKQQSKFVKEFFIGKGIETSVYYLRGDGFMNVPFDEYSKKDIRLSIEPTSEDLTKFSKMLCKTDKYDLCAFKKSSSISKEFAQKCVDEKIVINLMRPRISDYFPSLGYHGCSYSQFPNGDDLYIKVDCEYLKEDDTPEGFTEIKTSEFYIAKEKYESDKKI